MSEKPTFDEISGKFFGLHGTEETQQAAYDLITEAAPRFPEEGISTINWRYCAAALLNKPDLAIEIFQEGIEAGVWWTEEYLRSDEDLKSLQDLPEFNRIVAESDKLHQAAAAGAKPLALTLPLPAQASDPLPVLLALHGNTQNADNSVTFWESAVEHGWLTVLPQSSQLFFTDSYVWDDLEFGAKEIKDHYNELTEKHQIDSEQIVVSGFSKGGEMAIWFALMEMLPVAGFISVNPGGPFIADIDKWLPLIDNCKRLKEMRGFFVAGENDPNVEQISALSELFVSKGMACELVIAPSIAHDFPEDFNEKLANALQYIQE